MHSKNVNRGLGKGLGALLGDDALGSGNSVTLRITDIEPNLSQPRKDFEETALNELADSIGKHGLLQPLAVRKMEGGYYQIIAGERRWRAARIAGLEEVPAVIIEADDKSAMELALIENLQREDLNNVEEAEGYRTLIDQYGLTQEEVAVQVGKSRPAVANSLRLLALSKPVLDRLAKNELSGGHARALLALSTRQQQESVAEKVVAEGLSVRQVETLVKRINETEKKAQDGKPKERLSVNYLEDLERTLSERFGRKTKIVSGRKKGRIELEFYGRDDLDALLKLLSSL
ncbi:ParB/RepB/Spo0J family partition protein [Oscillospiraceae bacterium OttesenSCG-928-F05]|nr:ParB/RepB/Spo0J family partition protein [Oscillospiraceae bacterium OttesenSCG-928-F05]